jgi:hypothetical protein
MSKDPANLEKALAKKARKQARKAELREKKARVVGFGGPAQVSVKGAQDWSLSDVWISSEWRDTQQLCQIALTRQHANGRVAVGLFLVDLGCLGVKNADVRGFISEYEFRTEFLEMLGESQKLVTCSGDLAAKIILEGIAYAKSLGFEPHRDTRDALKFLHDLHPEQILETIPTGGKDGKPLFIAGPYDNSKKIITTLNRTLGEGNYNFIAPPEAFGDGILDLSNLFGEDFEDSDELDDESEDDEFNNDKIIDVQAKTLE